MKCLLIKICAAWMGLGLLSGSLMVNAIAERPRVIVLTDISNEPDDEQSLVRFLTYANEFDVEGLIATTSTHLKSAPREDIIRRTLEAYGKVHGNLSKHAPGYPKAESLLAITKTGQPAYGKAGVGDGKNSAGSDWIIKVVDRNDERPVWICVWGGPNTLAQALHDVKASRDEVALKKFVSKLRVYTISDQDDSAHWMRPEFPDLFYIVSPANVGSDYWKATWGGISGDRFLTTGVMHHFEMVDNPWLEENIIKNHGPLGDRYPKLTYLMEGDTPSFLGLINNGLGWQIRPDYGGWGGRYQLATPYGERRRIWTETQGSRDTVTSSQNNRTETSHQATIWRWREHFQNDFAARMDWCVAENFKNANHNPVAVLNGDKSKDVINIKAKPGETIQLSAEGTHDPDGDKTELKWWIYKEASSLKEEKTQGVPESARLSTASGSATMLKIPMVKRPSALHVILEVSDGGRPKLWAYRRAVIEIKP